MKIETGEPPCDGRYIVWVAIPNSEHAEPKVADRLRNAWLWEQRVLGWFGPLPVAPTIDSLRGVRQVELPEPQEYDL